ncbi:MAG: penicillin-binding protein [Moorella sp. (in: firmicutes)]|jgi:peptidoglycan glycosyltransferase|uniref:peptidoglycan D,D-transpeptidase FtsI family protein n=1 Tax=unclassified Neomoorella TaxID=2676739 RepID=UPI0010FFC160|nr:MULTISPECIES: penicillin-binding transpeptidase domain-containing protein [unclassified Moorella (in: firmicutes)]MDK2815634.1 penicillin-binding protein [Moorella sp. (in: firmicutes)]MDK2894180.1 penicillin-binding protein [Moorella sp. (in: firmicutes)]GEA15093.1 peptidoglycan glycosyltransferase [Moorella sp. E308F]GEA16996.1 peptidoglycan glycosyltransferase [Moorella sp. E306M]
MKTGVRRLALATGVFFVILIVYLTYIQAIAGERLYLNPLNPRLNLVEQQTERGTIYDRAGRVLARTVGNPGQFQRQYPYGQAAAQVVGYVSGRFGSSGLEASRDGDLLGLTGWQQLVNKGRRLIGQAARGNDLHLTLDADLQSLATNLLAGRRGAVVALDPRTGAVLALASSPAFDPNRLEEEWQRINSPGAGSPLLNRAIQGLYPPGSIMKLVTATAALEADPGILQRDFYCPGYLEVQGWKLTCPRPHGHLNFQQAMMYSCNVTFATLALEAGADKFKETAALYGFDKPLKFDLPVEESRVPGRLDASALAGSSIGQGAVLATPLQMAMVTAAIANKGILMQPYLVEKVTAAGGRLLWQAVPRPLQVVTGARVAADIKNAMVATVNGGTATAASLPGTQVAAKTGSAQNPGGETHAWLVAFAPAEEPRIAVAVVVENAGAGGAVAAPIAREIMAAALRR